MSSELPHPPHHPHDHAIRYGSFQILDGIATWNRDHGVAVAMAESPAVSCQLEGVWDPLQRPPQPRYTTALAGVCIWGKYDCLFIFKPKGKGNPGAERSLSSPKDKADLLKRLHKGEQVEKIILTTSPFGSYQLNTMEWQAEVVARYEVQKLYYVLPLEEYQQTLAELRHYLPPKCVDAMADLLEQQHQQMRQQICSTVNAEVEFIYPLRDGHADTIEASYLWPYQNLPLDLAIEEMEEIRIPYQCWHDGYAIPPILLGMLGDPCPYYERRSEHEATELTLLYPDQMY